MSSEYVYSARMVGKKGHVLKSSGMQSPEAANTWLRLAANPQTNMTIVDSIFKKGTTLEINPRLAMDFRESE